MKKQLRKVHLNLKGKLSGTNKRGKQENTV